MIVGSRRLKKHHLLAGLEALWDYPPNLLNRILWAFTDETWYNTDSVLSSDISMDREMSIGYANAYLHLMNGQGVTDPKKVWDD